MVIMLWMSKQSSRKRHLLKALTWRVTATTTTFIITWIVTGNLETGLIVGGIEATIKMFLYYFHERVWYRIPLGLESAEIRARKK